MKESNHEGAQLVHLRGKLKSCSLFCRRFGIVFFFGGALLGNVNQQHDTYAACFAGLFLALVFWATSKGMDWHIAAYDRRQEGVVRNIWQE